MNLQGRKGWVKGVAFGCTHLPHMDEKAFKQVLDVIRDEKPDHIVHTGDLLDADAASKFYSEQGHTLKDEYASGDKVLAAIRGAAKPGAILERVKGNHCDNLGAEGRFPEKVRELLQPEHWIKELEHWRETPYINDRKYSVKIGQVTLLHGFECGQNSDRNEAVKFGCDYGLVIRSHTHRLRQVTRARINLGLPLDRWFANVGTLCNIPYFKEEHYARRSYTDEWAPGVCVFLCNPKRRYYGSRQWDARVIELDH